MPSINNIQAYTKVDYHYGVHGRISGQCTLITPQSKGLLLFVTPRDEHKSTELFLLDLTPLKGKYSSEELREKLAKFIDEL